MRHRVPTVAALALSALLAACSGSPAASPTTTPGSSAGAPAGSAAPSGAGAAPSQGGATAGGDAVVVVLTGGQDAGTYRGGDNPNCTYGLVGKDGWGVQYSVEGQQGLSSLQLIDNPNASADSSGFGSVQLMTTVTIGGIGSGRDYEISKSLTEDPSGDGSVQVDDQGQTATIRLTGKTAEGVGIDVTVSCPSVMRVNG